MLAYDLPSCHSSLVGELGSQPSLVHSSELWPWETPNFRATPLSNSFLELEMYKGTFFNLSCVESYSGLGKCHKLGLLQVPGCPF